MHAIITNRPEWLAQAIRALYTVTDPEMGLSVIDLGLIEQIDFDKAGKQVFCRMTLTTAFCHLGEAISHQVKLALEEAFEGFSAEVNIDFAIAWTPDRISEAGKSILHR